MGIAVNGSNVYWADYGTCTSCSPSVCCTGGIWTTPTGGGTVAALAVALSGPMNLVLDGSYAYFVENNSSGGGAGLFRVSKSGGTPLYLGSGTFSGGLALDTTDTNLFFSNGNGPFGSLGSITKISIFGGAETTFASSQNQPMGIAVDSTRAYWADQSAGTIMTSTLSGGSPSTLASGGTCTTSVALDSSCVYWTESLCFTNAIGAVKKIAKP
jgi:hypothetical protein